MIKCVNEISEENKGIHSFKVRKKLGKLTKNTTICSCKILCCMK